MGLLVQAALLLGCGEAADAEACCLRALRIRQDLHGPDSREVSAAKCTLADTLRELGRCANALQACMNFTEYFHPFCVQPCSSRSMCWNEKREHDGAQVYTCIGLGRNQVGAFFCLGASLPPGGHFVTPVKGGEPPASTS